VDLPERYEETGDEFSGGGMSNAIVCTDRHLDRLVLVKSLDFGVDEKRLLDEIAALSSIRSKHVVQIYDVLRDKDGKLAAIVEEYLPGADLNSKIPISDPEEVMRIGYAIACGITDIHERGRVHRDIKPNNMKFDGENCLKIFDFGLSRSDDMEAKTVGTVGTKGYLAPELCADDEDDTIEFSQPIDVYAYGATMLKAVRGNLPPDLRKVPPELPCADANFQHQKVVLPPRLP